MVAAKNHRLVYSLDRHLCHKPAVRDREAALSLGSSLNSNLESDALSLLRLWGLGVLLFIIVNREDNDSVPVN